MIPPWRSFPARGPVELDEFDRRLLAALQEDSRRTGEQLAALVGLSPAACLRRKKSIGASTQTTSSVSGKRAKMR